MVKGFEVKDIPCSMKIASRVIKKLDNGKILYEINGVNIPAYSMSSAIDKWRRAKKEELS